MSKIRTITPNPPADFVPSKNDVSYLRPFRVWCQKVLPLVYDDSLSYYELLCKVVDYLNKTMEEVNQLGVDVSNLFNAFQELQGYVNNYFDSLDVQEEINNKLDQMVEDGTLAMIIGDKFLFKHDSSPVSTNNAGAVSEMFECANTYLKSGSLYYGNFYTAYDYKNNPVNGVNENRQYQIDCSSFVELVLRGCDFDASRYNTQNEFNFPNRSYSYSYYNELSGNNGETADYPIYRYTYQQAVMAKQSGYSVSPNYDWSNIFPGDVVWLTEDTSTPITDENPLGVDHCMIYFGRHISGDLMFFEAGGLNSNMVSVLKTNGVVKVSRRTLSFMLDRTKVVARFPLGVANASTDNVLPYIGEVTGTSEMQYFNLNKTLKSGSVVTLFVEYKGSAPTFAVDIGYQGYAQNSYIERLTFPIVLSNDTSTFGFRGEGCTLYNAKVYEGYAFGPYDVNFGFISGSDYSNPSKFSVNKVSALKTDNGYGLISRSINNDIVGLFNVNNSPLFVNSTGGSYALLLSDYVQGGVTQMTSATVEVEFTVPFNEAPTVIVSGNGSPAFAVNVGNITTDGFSIVTDSSNVNRYVQWMAIRKL